MENSMLNKLNKVYFAKLNECLAEKLGKGTDVDFKYPDIDVKTDIASNISIYTIMADYILESTEKKPDINNYKQVLIEQIKKDAKFIINYVNENVKLYIEERGDKKAVEFKCALIGKINKTLNQIEKENSCLEQEKE